MVVGVEVDVLAVEDVVVVLTELIAAYAPTAIIIIITTTIPIIALLLSACRILDFLEFTRSAGEEWLF